jgi:hypothetical protein
MKPLELTTETKSILGFAACKFLLHLFTITNYELHPDAYLYLAHSDHLGSGYLAVPPFIAFVGKLALLPPEQQEKTIIYANNYGQAGAIKLYNRMTDTPEPVSFSGSFRFWAPDRFDATTMIVVGFDTDFIRQNFEQVRLVARVTDPYARESGLPVYLCEHPKPGVADYFEKVVHEKKAEFGD